MLDRGRQERMRKVYLSLEGRTYQVEEYCGHNEAGKQNYLWQQLIVEFT